MMDFMIEKMLLPLLILVLIVGILILPVLLVKHNQYEVFLKDCFMQAERTKECEYALWQYENRTKISPAIVTTPVLFK